MKKFFLMGICFSLTLCSFAQSYDTIPKSLLLGPSNAIGRFIGFGFPNPGNPKLMYIGNNTISVRSFEGISNTIPAVFESGHLVITGDMTFKKKPIIARNPAEAKAKGVKPNGVYRTPTYGTLRFCECN